MSASLAVSIPHHQQQGGKAAGPQQEPSVAATNSVAYKRQNKPVVYAEASVEANGGGGGGIMEGGVSALLEVIASPKKLLGVAFNFVVAQLKALTLKRVLKIALVGALVTVLGAVAAVSVAGLVSLVSGLCAAWPYLQMFMGGGGGGGGLLGLFMGGGGSGGNDGGSENISDEHMDTITEFVLGAMDKYEQKKNH